MSILYHYTKRDTALKDILWEDEFMLSPLAQTNDPKDSDPRRFSISIDIEDDTAPDFLELGKEADQFVRDGCHLGCFTLDRAESVSDSSTDSTRYGDGPLRARMWAQYADNHDGICLIFDQEALEDAVKTGLGPDDFINCKRVSYMQPPEVGSDPYELPLSKVRDDFPGLMEKMFLIHQSQYFFEKNWDWESESEYRVLVKTKSDKPITFPIADCLEGICLGSRFPKVYNKSIIELSELRSVGIFQVGWTNGRPQLLPMDRSTHPE